MVSTRTRSLKQKAVLWPATNDGDAADYNDYGERKLDAKEEIICRWEIKTTESLDPQGQTVAFSETVYVDKAIIEGSIMWKGELCNLPATPTNLRRVEAYEELPDIKGKNPLRMVRLMKYSDELPELS
jgi:hypothetical protein